MGAAIIMSVVAAALLGGLFWASYSIRSGVYAKALCRAGTEGRRAVALTFDDGPHPEYTPRVLDVLKRHGVRATFFIVGEKAEAHPEIVKRIVAEGHLVGNHTYSHSPRFPLMSARRMEEEMRRCDEALEKITGAHRAKPAELARPTLFRPPFGVTNPPLARAVREGGYTVAGWDIRSLDTVSRRPRTKIVQRVRRRLRPGSVILLHDDRPDSDALLEMILAHLARNDYKTERFDKLFGL